MAKKKSRGNVKAKVTSSSGKSIGQGTAVTALILNILIPGLGTLLAGKTREGLYQILLAVIGWAIILGFNSSVFIIGFALILGAWIWGIVRGVKLVSGAFK